MLLHLNRSRILLILTFIGFFALIFSGASSNRRFDTSIPYEDRLAQSINTHGHRVIVVAPAAHVWGAYNEEGRLIRAGLATAGSSFCSDLRRPCRTRSGVFRINSLGGPGCKSSIFPIPTGGAPMPYCMFFNKGQALHGTPSDHVVEGNVSHGCVRMHVEDARWVRYEFAYVGMKVIIYPY